MAGNFPLVLVLGIAIAAVGIDGNDNLDKLAKYLTERSNPDVAPLPANSEALKVTLKYAIFNVADVDKERNVVEIERATLQHWDTQRFRFASRDYGGLTAIVLPRRYFWTPELHSLSTSAPYGDLGPQVVSVFSNGTVATLSVFRERIPCDVSGVAAAAGATCFNRLSLWRYPKSQVNYVIHARYQPHMFSYFAGSKYEVLATNMTSFDSPWFGDVFQFLNFYITIREKGSQSSPSPVP